MGNAPVNAAKTTRRFYGFEATLEEMPNFAALKKQRSLAELQLCAGYVWACERGRGKCPLVRPRPGDTSYYVWSTRAVELAPKHRNFCGLLHELAHALGTRDKLEHGPAFRKRCLRLYMEYGGWDGKVAL